MLFYLLLFFCLLFFFYFVGVLTVLEHPLHLSRERDTDLKYIKDFLLDTATQQIRILFFGPVGVGKSSFINTVHSALQGRIYTQAGVDNTSSKSYTKKVKRNLQPFFEFIIVSVTNPPKHGERLKWLS